ncbi:MAG: ligase-associated DNA damage response endonuclease PdeM [Desulfobacterales bacterium]|nr:ligase-associated DNA damage response endonuclease PdeM [Desulfobacterales bacterium]
MTSSARHPSSGRARDQGCVVEHVLRDQRLMLLPERALFWQEKKMLVVADAHFGKAQLFRERGIPVPQGTTAADLQRLSLLLAALAPETLLFLGDLTHGPIDDPDIYERLIAPWRAAHAQVAMTLVSGNHDRWSGPPSSAFGIDWVGEERQEDPFVFTHKPQGSAAGYNLAGHLHPAVAMRGRGGLAATLPCFCFGPDQALLPAFGGFTGCQVIRPGAEDQVFVVADEAVMALPAKAGG